MRGIDQKGRMHKYSLHLPFNLLRWSQIELLIHVSVTIKTNGSIIALYNMINGQCALLLK